MAKTLNSRVEYEFGPYRLDTASQRLWRDGNIVRLTPKVFETLLYLVEHNGKVLPKEAIIRAVWPDRFVEEANLTQNISVLRRTLRETETGTKYIATYPGSGYQFIAPVQVTTPAPSPAEERPTAPPPAPAPLAPTPKRLSPWLPSLWSVLLWALVLTGGLLWLRPSATEATVLPSRQPLTRLPGAEYQPAISPDGHRVAFVWDQEHAGAGAIFVKNPEDDQPRQISSGGSESASPAWAPDGRHVAYLRFEPGALKIMITGQRDEAERQVATLFPSRYGLNCRHLDWSPDGRRLVFDDKESEAEPFGLYLIDIETGTRTRLTRPSEDIIGDVDPRFSPDGTTISFVRMTYRFNHEIYTVPAAGGKPHQYTHDSKRISGQDWAHDGRVLYFASDRDGAYRIWKLDMGSGTLSPTTLSTSNPIQFSVSRSGSKLVFSDLLQDLNIWSFPVGKPGGTWTRVVGSTAEDSLPQLSPDGKRICFQSDRSGEGQLWIADAQGGNASQITRGTVRPAVGRWSPDGKTLVFNDVVTQKMYLVDAGGGAPRAAGGTPITGAHPVFSPDGRGVFYTANDKLMFLALPSGEKTEIASRFGFQKVPSADGKAVYFTGGRTDSTIWRLHLSTGERESVVNDLRAGYWGAWTISSKGVYYLRAQSADAPESGIYFFSFAEKKKSRVTGFPGPLPPIGTTTWALSPDEQLLYAVRVDTSSSDLSSVEPLR